MISGWHEVSCKVYVAIDFDFLTSWTEMSSFTKISRFITSFKTIPAFATLITIGLFFKIREVAPGTCRTRELGGFSSTRRTIMTCTKQNLTMKNTTENPANSKPQGKRRTIYEVRFYRVRYPPGENG